MKKLIIKFSSSVIFFVLIAAMALTMTACGGKDTVSQASTPEVSSQSEAETVGKGSKEFNFSVVDKDGFEKKFTVKTDETTVGAALQSYGLIKGEDGDYGLYVKEVNGITADYNVDGTYWAFYIDGEYAMTGVDATPIEDGKVYCFKAEKA